MIKALNHNVNTSCTSADGRDTLSNRRIDLSACIGERSCPSYECFSRVASPARGKIIQRNAVFIQNHEPTNRQRVIRPTLDVTDRLAAHINSEIESQVGIKQTSSERNNSRKKVHFGHVTVREYGVTVGALSGARDSCPMQLTWDYTEYTFVQIVDKSGSRGSDCRKLTLHERRKRIAAVQGIAVANVKALELQTLLDEIQSSTDFYHKLLAPDDIIHREKRCIDDTEQKRSVSMAA